MVDTPVYFDNLATTPVDPRVVEAIGRQSQQLLHMSGTDFYYALQRDLAQKLGFIPTALGQWINADGDIAIPFYQGRMVNHSDFSAKAWVTIG